MAEKENKKTQLSKSKEPIKPIEMDNLSVTISFEDLIKLSVKMPKGEDKKRVKQFIKDNKPPKSE